MMQHMRTRNQQLKTSAATWNKAGCWWALSAAWDEITGGSAFWVIGGLVITAAAVAAWCVAARCDRMRQALIDAEAAVFARELERL